MHIRSHQLWRDEVQAETKGGTGRVGRNSGLVGNATIKNFNISVCNIANPMNAIKIIVI